MASVFPSDGVNPNGPYNFGVGNWFCKRTDAANQTVTLLGVLQDMELDIDRTMKELIGQYALPVDVAQAQMKITGKAKYAQVGLGNLNNTILGQTLTSNSGFQIAAPENHTGALTITVTNGATFSEDLGVRYHSTGNPLQPVTGSPNAGQYVAGAAGVGSYNFNSADTVSLDIYYSYTVTTMQQISAVNQLMGTLRPFINKELNRQDITIHGLRGTFKNWATHRGYPDIVVEFCLDHKYGTQIENVYRSEPLVDERRRLLQAWSDYC